MNGFSRNQAASIDARGCSIYLVGCILVLLLLLAFWLWRYIAAGAFPYPESPTLMRATALTELAWKHRGQLDGTWTIEQLEALATEPANSFVCELELHWFQVAPGLVRGAVVSEFECLDGTSVGPVPPSGIAFEFTRLDSGEWVGLHWYEDLDSDRSAESVEWPDTSDSLVIRSTLP